MSPLDPVVEEMFQCVLDESAFVVGGEQKK